MQTSTTTATIPSQSASSSLTRWSVFLFGITCYGIGVAGLVWLILCTFGVVPFTGGPLALESTGAAIAFNLALVSLFAVQHEIMARPGFKEKWTRIVPQAVERPIFVALSGAIMAFAMWMWQPLDGVLWSVESTAMKVGLWGLCGAGWAYMLLATFAIDHFHLFGLRQVYDNLKGREAASPNFVQRLMYGFDRHPLMTGALFGLWATPHMALDHLVLALGMTLFVIIGVSFEERDLVALHGDDYREYRKKVGTIVPRFTLRD